MMRYLLLLIALSVPRSFASNTFAARDPGLIVDVTILPFLGAGPINFESKSCHCAGVAPCPNVVSDVVLRRNVQTCGESPNLSVTTEYHAWCLEPNQFGHPDRLRTSQYYRNVDRLTGATIVDERGLFEISLTFNDAINGILEINQGASAGEPKSMRCALRLR